MSSSYRMMVLIVLGRHNCPYCERARTRDVAYPQKLKNFCTQFCGDRVDTRSQDSSDCIILSFSLSGARGGWVWHLDPLEYTIIISLRARAITSSRSTCYWAQFWMMQRSIKNPNSSSIQQISIVSAITVIIIIIFITGDHAAGVIFHDITKKTFKFSTMSQFTVTSCLFHRNPKYKIGQETVDSAKSNAVSACMMHRQKCLMIQVRPTRAPWL